MEAVVIAVTEPREIEAARRAERDVCALAALTTVIDRRRHLGEGLVLCPLDNQREIEMLLASIDKDWEDGLEIIDPGLERIRQYLSPPKGAG